MTIYGGWVNLVIDFPHWSASVWINIITSITVGICVLTWITFGWIRRNRLNVVQDSERLSITSVLFGLLAFFLGRGVQIWIAGSTVAEPWFLGIGVYLAIASVVNTMIVMRNHDDYGVLGTNKTKWEKGDPDRRVGDRRMADRRKKEETL